LRARSISARRSPPPWSVKLLYRALALPRCIATGTFMLRAASLVAVLAVSGAALADDPQSTANFYATDSECEFEFTIADLKGSLTWADGDLRLRLPDEAFVVADGKLAKNADDIFFAIAEHKTLALGLWRDGMITPINLIGLDPKPFVACVMQRWRSLKHR
jgi:hypothetical protein